MDENLTYEIGIFNALRVCTTFGFVWASSAHHLAPNTTTFKLHNLKPVSYWLPLKDFLHHLLTTNELHTNTIVCVSMFVVRTSLI